MKRFITKTLFLFILFISFSLQNSITQIHVPHSKTQEEFVFDGLKEKSPGTTDEMLQFTAAGHILGFRKGDVLIASGDHALRIEFVNARPASPVNEGISPDKENNRQTAEPLGRVSYSDLWDGVTLVYERHSTGVVKSTYTIQPEGTDASSPADRIRLRYNVPVAVDEGGNLVFSFETGQMKEPHPVAWQKIKGEHVPVEVSFRSLSEREVGFKVGSYDPQFPLVIDGALIWNTFMGSSSFDYGNAIAVDGSGNVYVAGESSATWGTPVNPHAGSAGFFDAFAAKLNSSGVRQWHTFMGAANFTDDGYGIAVDGTGNVYVAGRSNATWGAPVNAHAGGNDVFAAKLDSSGVRQWNTFMGSSDYDYGWALAVDGSGNVYVTGESYATWGAPVNPHTGFNLDAFAAKLNNSGVRQWHTFMGSTDDDIGYGIAVDGSGNVYVAGRSSATWGSPVNAHAGLKDVFAAKLDGSGIRQWHTFMGSASDDYGGGIAVDSSGNVYVAGYSNATWGTPVNAHTALSDAFAAKLNSSGVRQWHTFMGSFQDDNGWGIAVDTSGNVYIAGSSVTTWGTPINPHTGGNSDAFAAKLNSSGVRRWNTFMGSAFYELGYAIAVDMSGNAYVAGYSYANWGTPINPHTGGLYDAFAAKIAASMDRYLLWTRESNGWISVWTLDSSGGFVSGTGYIASGWIATSYFRNSDGTAHILLTRPAGGQAFLWNLDASGAIAGGRGYWVPGWSATSYFRNSDGTAHLLWTRSGQAAVWNLNASGNTVGGRGYNVSGWTATSYFRNSDGTAHLLWTKDGQAAVWNLNASGNCVGGRGYSVSGWTASSYHRNSDGTAHLLWTKDGQAAVWNLNASGNCVGGRGYSAAGWIATSYLR